MAEAQKGIGIDMKKHRTMILFLAIFVVLFGLYIVMKYMNKIQAEKEQGETIMVTQLEDLSSMEYTDGETTISFVKEEDAWKQSGDDSINLDNDAVQTIADTLCQIAAVRVLEGADELSSYGLEEPAYTISLETESGTEVTLYIGDATGENYYATIGDKVVVCVIDSSAVDALEFDITALEAEEEAESESEDDTSETTEETTE